MSYGSEYRKKNKEKITEQKAKYYQDHKEEISDYNADYYKNNKDKIMKRRNKLKEERRHKGE